MLHIDLFTGFAGFALAARWMDWKTVLTCEIEDYPNQIIKRHFPDAYHHKDIHDLTYDTINTELSKRFGTHWREDNLILTGGFP